MSSLFLILPLAAVLFFNLPFSFLRKGLIPFGVAFAVLQAVAAMFDLVREINRGNEKGMDVSKAKEMLKELAGVIGFTLQETKKVSGEIEAKIDDLIAKRIAYRKAKEWKQADEVRNQLTEMGVAIEDTPKGTSWKLTR